MAARGRFNCCKLSSGTLLALTRAADSLERSCGARGARFAVGPGVAAVARAIADVATPGRRVGVRRTV